jgi:hypothetical protein
MEMLTKRLRAGDGVVDEQFAPAKHGKRQSTPPPVLRRTQTVGIAELVQTDNDRLEAFRDPD